MMLSETCTHEMMRKARRPILSWSLMHLKSDSAVKFKTICQCYCSPSHDRAVYHGNVAHLQFGIQPLTLSAPQMYSTHLCDTERATERRKSGVNNAVDGAVPGKSKLHMSTCRLWLAAILRLSCKNLNTMPDSAQTDVNLCDTCPCLYGYARHLSRPRSSNNGPDNDSVRVVSPMSSCFTLQVA